MDVLQHSLIARVLLPLWLHLVNYYENSLLAWLMRGLSGLFGQLWRGSIVGETLTREGALSRAWSRSAFSELLGMLLNLPGLLLKALYRALRPVFDGSIAARVGFAIVENTPIAVGWLMLVILVIPFDYWNNAYGLMGFALMLVFAIFACMRKKSRRLDAESMGPYAVAFAGFVILAAPLSAYVHLSQRFLLYHLACILCVLVIVSTVERAYQLRRLAGMATAGLVVVSGYGIVQRFQGVEVNTSYVDILLNRDMPGRVFSMYENPNAFGEVLVLLIPVAIGLMFASKGWGGRFLGLLGAGMGTIALVMTYSRAGWIGLVVSAMIFLFLWNRKLLPAVILIGFAAIPFLPDTVFNRILTIFNFEDTSTASRFPLYDAALRLLKARPLQGAGLGSDAVRSAVADLNFYHGEAPFVHSHNMYMQTWAETGLFGLLTLLGTVGWTLKKAARTVFGHTGSHSVRMVIIGSVSALIGIMVCGMADFIWHYPRVMLIFWFVFALAIAGIRLALSQEQQRAREARRLAE